jgi:hypothetical protein
MTELLHLSICLTLQILRPATTVSEYMEPLPDYWLMVLPFLLMMLPFFSSLRMEVIKYLRSK